MAGSVGAVEDFIVEDGEVQCETKSDRMCRREFSDGDIGSSLVGLERLVSTILALITSSELGEIAMVVAHPKKRH